MQESDYSLGLYEKAMPAGMDFPAMLRETQECGFDRLEISIDESDERLARLDWSREKRKALRETGFDLGVPIETMCLSGHRRFPLGSHDAVVREKGLEIMQKALQFASDIGVRIIQLAGYDVYYEESDVDTRAWFLENLEKSVEWAAKAGVILAFETMETPFMDTVTKAMEFVRRTRSPYLGVYPDIGNLKNASLLYGSNLCEDIHYGAEHIFAAHLKETAPGVYRNMHFGEGHTEYQPCIEELWRCGVRMYTAEFWCLDEIGFREELKKAEAFLRRKIDDAILALGKACLPR